MRYSQGYLSSLKEILQSTSISTPNYNYATHNISSKSLMYELLRS